MSSIANTKVSKLYVAGTPLDEGGALSENLKVLIPQCQLVIGESRKTTMRYLLQCENFPDDKDVFFLDNIKPAEMSELKGRLRSLVDGGVAVLFSDCGMPVLFDPGQEVLEYARECKFEIHSVPGPTSWATACALSGYQPPFYIQGFLSQKSEKRLSDLQILKALKSHLVILETPYRYEALLKDLTKVFGPDQEVFLGWELGTRGEFLFWGTLKSLVQASKERGLAKGEFVVIIK